MQNCGYNIYYSKNGSRWRGEAVERPILQLFCTIEMIPESRRNSILRLFRSNNVSFNPQTQYFNLVISKALAAELFPNRWICAHRYAWGNDEVFKKVKIETDQVGVYCLDNILERGFIENDENPGVYFNAAQSLSGYHAQEPSWRTNSVKNGKLLGVELEIQTKSQSERYKLQRYIGKLGIEYALIEQDGSLDCNTGAEIVFKPQTLEEIKSDEFKSVLEKINSYCSNAVQPIGYGMHLNVSDNWFTGKTDLHKLKFAHQLDKARETTEKIAQRTANNYSQSMGNVKISQRKKCPRYSFANLQPVGRVEVRIFRSVLDWLGFSRQVDYTTSVIDYTKDASLRELNETFYHKWMQDKFPRKHKFLFG